MGKLNVDGTEIQVLQIEDGLDLCYTVLCDFVSFAFSMKHSFIPAETNRRLGA